MRASGATTAALRKPAREAGKSAAAPSSAYAAIVVGPKSSIYTPQQLADVPVGVPFYFGTHYVALHLLQGFVPRDMVKLCSAPSRSYFRLQALLAGDSPGDDPDRTARLARREAGLPHHLLIVLSRHRGGLRSRRCRDLRRVQPRRPGSRAADQRQQVGLYAPLHRLPCEAGRDRRRHAQGLGPARKPPRRDRSLADTRPRSFNAPPNG